MHKYMNYNKTKLINGKTYQFLIFCYIFILHALEVIQNCMVERVCQQLCFFSYSTSEILHWSLAIPHCAFMSQKSSDAINQGFSSQIATFSTFSSTPSNTVKIKYRLVGILRQDIYSLLQTLDKAYIKWHSGAKSLFSYLNQRGLKFLPTRFVTKSLETEKEALKGETRLQPYLQK